MYLKQFQFKSIPSRLLRYLLKTIAQSVFLAASLFITCASASEYPRHISVQNPPSIPSLLIAFVFAQLFDAKFVIDWHNYGYSIMALQKANSLIVRIATIYEKVLARMSDANFTVTKAMMNDVRSWGASNIRVLYDKPHCRFHRLDHAARNEFLLQIQNQIPSVEKVLNGVPLLVSATSWTEDEDFSILLDALSICNESKMEMVVVITGKGPQKEFYLAEIKRRAFQHISIVTPWLEVEDYPKLLGSATLGVSLHSSSSGLDLPMKGKTYRFIHLPYRYLVVDMFGAGLPVFALNFPALPELVKDGRNGRIFNNSEELANLILTGLKDKNQLDDWRDFIEATRESWSDHWSNTAKEIFL